MNKFKAILSTTLAVATVFTSVAGGATAAYAEETTKYIEGGAATFAWAETVGDAQGIDQWNYDLTIPVNTKAKVLVYKDNVKEAADFRVEQVTDATTGAKYESEYLNMYYYEGSLISTTNTTATPTYTSDTIYASEYEPGVYNVVLYSFDAGKYENAYNASDKPNTIKRADYYTITTIGQITVSSVFGVSTTVTKNSVQLNMTNNDTKVTGYTVYRKVGKKYVKLGTTTAAYYVDKNLAKNQKYSYKVVPYYIDDKGVKTEGVERKVRATTTGGNFDLTAVVTSKKGNAVKLSWNKVDGAKKYNIYRLETCSDSSKVKNGKGNGYHTYKLIKSVKKSKKTYTDKSVESGTYYSYYVDAVLDNDCVASADASVTTEFTAPSVETKYANADGSYTITWKKNPAVDGYIVYQNTYNETTKQWDYTAISTLPATATSTVLPAVPASVFDDDKVAAAIAIPEEPEYPYSWNYTFDEETGKYTYSGKVYDSYDAMKSAYNSALAEYNKAYNDRQEKINLAARNNSVSYIIRAYKGSVVSEYISQTVYPTIASVASVTTTVVENGIKVSWTEVPGATAYKVYRIKEDSFVKNADSGVYNVSGKQEVVNYVGLTALTASVDSTATDVRYNQNFTYATSIIPAGTTSVLDYAGQIASVEYNPLRDAEGNYVNLKDAAGTEIKDTLSQNVRTVYKGVKAEDLYVVGPKKGCSYQYVVEALYDADYDLTKDYDDYSTKEDGTKVYYNHAIDPATNSWVTVAPYARNVNANVTSSIKAVSNAVTMTAATAPSKLTIKSIKAKKTTVTVTLKKVESGTTVKVYRATKKKGAYTLVGTTTSKKFTDKTVEKGKTYYYKVVASKANEAGADVDSAASKVKSVKVK